MNEAQTDTQLSASAAVGEGGREGWMGRLAHPQSKGTRQIAQGHFLFPWTLQAETPLFSETIKNGVRHEVRDEGGGLEGRRD